MINENTTVTTTCPKCGKPMPTKAVEVVLGTGKCPTRDKSVRAPKCDSCDYYELSQQQLEDAELRTAVVLLHDYRTIYGNELKYVRKALGLKQVELVKILDVKPETLCRLEKGEEAISRTTHLALERLVCLRSTDQDECERELRFIKI